MGFDVDYQNVLCFVYTNRFGYVFVIERCVSFIK